ncbi:MAG: ZIP family metal transporter [Rhodospirillaceae bacterium]|mgnify:CR=1 FL=1|jgi:zinc transporter 1/2/3|nr:ZIP family metal transporter [Rhodospirillaceae bacterium]MBT3931243.1 ZIP family metal transporter [Rhodospirillaceae bacterium]MBT4772639.1 ZIP family metal transporter [Rhodospirillaceae bacterium]MBT5358183.1 ZIP family metal transporter [Rhodospirillaceae bacterium]MBT5769777.1 ZIP family metal transporter [Rhodospirillaceae bacterium]
MSLLAIKAIAILVILLTALLGGLAALRTRQSRHADRLFALGSLFGAGVFLGAGLIHVLPDSVDLFSRLYPKLDYPVPFGIVALGLISVLAVDRFGHRLQARSHAVDSEAGAASAMILLVVLSFHSILAGAALGAEDSAANSIVLLLAVVAHKGSAAFALTSGLLRVPVAGAPDDRKSIWGLLLVFALMTPLGILLGTGLQELLDGDAARVSEAVFDAFAAATFVYVATMEIIGPEFRSNERSLSKLGALTAGLAVMALVALWL